MGRYVLTTVAGAAVGCGWWSVFRAAQKSCEGGKPFCDLGYLILLPLVALASWLLPWIVLHLLHVEKPGALSATGVLFFLVLEGILLAGQQETAVPLTGWLTMTLVGAVSYVIAAMLTS